MASPTTSRAPRTAVLMGLGLVVLGAAGFGFLLIVGNTVSEGDKLALSNLYMIINIIGPGLFVSLEQETNRVVSSGVAAGVDPRPGLRRAAWIGLALAGLTAVVLLAGSPILISRNLGGHTSLLGWILLGALASMVIFLIRGALGAGQRYDGYAGTLITEGLARLLPCLALAFLGAASVNAFGLIYAGGTLVAVLVALPWLRSMLRELATRNAPAEVTPESAAAVTESHRAGAIAKGLVLLGVATLLAQLVANLAPLVVSGRMLDEKEVAVAFTFAFVLTRIPLLLFGPVQAMMLPTLTAAAVRGDQAEVRRRVGVILLAVAAVGLPGAVVSALIGPWLVVNFFQAKVYPDPLVMGLLGLSTVFLMIAQVLQPALVAYGRHRVVTAGWLAGTAVLVALMVWLPMAAIPAAVVAQLVGPALVVVITAAGLWRAIGGRAVQDRAPAPVS